MPEKRTILWVQLLLLKGQSHLQPRTQCVCLPAAIIGSAVAGGLTAMFKIGLPAPHGGVFVIPIIEGNPLLYILAIVVG